MIPLIKPHLPPPRKWEGYLARSYDTAMFSNRGPNVVELEERLRTFLGNSLTPILVSSCTAGLEAALLAAGIQHSDEVLVPTFTFTATAQAVLAVGATPVFVDVDEDSWVLDPNVADVSKKTKAVIFVAPFGYPVDYRKAQDFGRSHNLKVIIDSAAAFGSKTLEGLAGAKQGISEVFSFHATKSFGIGEGGLIIPADKDEEKVLRETIVFGMNKNVSVRHGRNYKIADVSAAIGLAVLDGFEYQLEERRANAKWFQEQGLEIRKNTSLEDMSNPMLPVLIEDAENVANQALKKGVMLGRLYRPLQVHPQYKTKKQYPVSARIFLKMLSLPTWVGITREMQEKVMTCLPKK